MPGKGEVLDAQQQILKPETSGEIDKQMGVEHPPEMPALTEQPEELEIDAFTMSPSLEKRNALTQIWKNNYNTQQQDNVQTPNAQQGQDTSVNPNIKPSDLNYAGGRLNIAIPQAGEMPNWDIVSEEIVRFLDMLGTGNIEEGMDYLISRETVLSHRFEQFFLGLPHKAEQKQMQQVFSKGHEKLEDGYTGRLKNTLCLSDGDTSRIRSSLRGIVSERQQVYEKAWGQIQTEAAMPRDGRPKTEDYLSAQLRSMVGRGGEQVQSKGISLADLRHAGQVANGYQMIYNNTKEITPRQLASDLASVDLKMKTMVDMGRIGKQMAKILQNTRAARHEYAMDLAEERAQMRKELTQQGAADHPKARFDRGLVKTIYDAIVHVFDRNGGDLPAALREGTAEGKQLSSLMQSDERYSKKRATLYEIDGRAAHGLNRAIVYFQQNGQVRDYILGGAAVAGFLGLLFFLH